MSLITQRLKTYFKRIRAGLIVSCLITAFIFTNILYINKVTTYKHKINANRELTYSSLNDLILSIRTPLQQINNYKCNWRDFSSETKRESAVLELVFEVYSPLISLASYQSRFFSSYEKANQLYYQGADYPNLDYYLNFNKLYNFVGEMLENDLYLDKAYQLKFSKMQNQITALLECIETVYTSQVT